MEASYTAIHQVLSTPGLCEAYAGKGAWDDARRLWVGAKNIDLTQSEWQVLIGYHEGFIDWRTYGANQKARLAANTRLGRTKWAAQ